MMNLRRHNLKTIKKENYHLQDRYELPSLLLYLLTSPLLYLPFTFNILNPVFTFPTIESSVYKQDTPQICFGDLVYKTRFRLPNKKTNTNIVILDNPLYIILDSLNCQCVQSRLRVVSPGLVTSNEIPLPTYQL